MSARSIAVLHRLHKHHLEAACKQSGKVPFYSGKKWKRAEQELEAHDYIDIYFIPDNSEQVEYAAKLVEVFVEPDLNATRMRQILAQRTDTTSEEDWSDCKTIYLIQDCRRLEKPLSKTTFNKISDNEPISGNFERGYAIVYARPNVN